MTFQDKQISEPQFLLCKLKVIPALSTQQGLTYQLHFVPEEISLENKTLGLLVLSERRSKYDHDSLCEVKWEERLTQQGLCGNAPQQEQPSPWPLAVEKPSSRPSCVTSGRDPHLSCLQSSHSKTEETAPGEKMTWTHECQKVEPISNTSNGYLPRNRGKALAPPVHLGHPDREDHLSFCTFPVWLFMCFMPQEF